MINSDYFLMSTNAITTDGELINIDGRANSCATLGFSAIKTRFAMLSLSSILILLQPK